MGSAVGVRALTGVLSPSTYGELTLAVTLSALTHQSILGPLAQAFLRYFAPSHELGRFGAYLRGMWHLLAWATGIVSGIALFAALLLFVLGHRELIGLVWGAFLLSLLFGVGSSFDAIQNAARHQAIVAWHQGITPWLRFAFAFGLAVKFGARTGEALLGYILGSALVFVSQASLFWRKIVSHSRPRSAVSASDAADLVGQMQAYAWPITTWGILTWLQMSSDRWALQVFGSAQNVGIYAVLYQLGYVPMTMASSLALQLIVPVVFSRSGDGTDVARLRSAHQLNALAVLGTMVATGLLTLGALLLRDHIFALLVGPQYRWGSVYLPLVVLAGGLFACGQTASLILMSEKDTRLLVRPKVVTALAGVLFNVAGAYWRGVPGVVVGNVLFGLFYFGWIAVLGWKQRESALSAAQGKDRKITLQPFP